jgi:copper transport protein
MNVRSWWLALALVVTSAVPALAHTTLVRAEPGAKSVLATCPSRVYLVFSEALEPGLARIDVDGVKLTTSGDPRDVHAVMAPIACPLPGAHKVTWHVVSADGHAVNGTYMFTVSGVPPIVDSLAATAPTVQAAPPAAAPPADTVVRSDSVSAAPAERAPVLASLLRGGALVTLMALAGLLFFRVPVRGAGMGTNELSLALASIVLLGAHLAVWAINSDSAHELTTSALLSKTGQRELWRLGLAVLALWALSLARRPKLAMLFACLALAVSGALGHPAAIHPEGTIAAKALHLMGGAVWLGGLLHLLTIPRGDSALFARRASYVSNVAFGAVVVVVLSGIVQWRYFLPTFGVLQSSYGVLLTAKLAGLAVLLVFGAHHRYRAIPRLNQAGRFDATLRAEIAVMILVAMVGALLSYTPPPVLS